MCVCVRERRRRNVTSRRRSRRDATFPRGSVTSPEHRAAARLFSQSMYCQDIEEVFVLGKPDTSSAGFDLESDLNVSLS